MSDPTRQPIGCLDAVLLDGLMEGCQVIGRDWRYLYVNEAAARHGRTTPAQLLGRTMMEAYPGIDATPMFDCLRRCMEEGTPHRMENEFRFPDGSTGLFELRFRPVPMGVFILSLDVTEQRRTEDQLRHAQRLESLGRLAGAVAHDMNNILSVILAFSCFAEEGLGEGNPVRGEIEEIKKATDRAVALNRQLLAFGRKQVLRPQILCLDDVLAGMEGMLRRVVGEDVLIRLVRRDGLGNVRLDPGQIEQAVMNLVVNARDAMPGGGQLLIETANAELDEHHAGRHLDVKPGPYVVLSVSDTGSGMDDETRDRIFEPFFTTKEPGKGTGLGLATVFGMVKQSGGDISCYSEPGKGTTFKLYFPRVLGAQ